MNQEFEKREKIVEIELFGKSYIFERKNKLENFGVIIPNLIYRGSWPSDINPLVEKGISRIVTLYSSNDESEIKDIFILKQKTKEFNIEHCFFDMVNNQSYWQAAKTALNTNQKTYVHCRGGSIRTGVVSFLIDLIDKNEKKQFCDEKKFEKLINKTGEYGYNYNNNKYRLLFEDIIKEAVDKKLLPNFFYKNK
jgi:hypothetical protein